MKAERKCDYCGKELDEVDIVWTWKDLCMECEINGKLSET